MKTKLITLVILIVFTTGCTAREIGLSAVGAASLLASLFIVHDVVNKDDKKIDDDANDIDYSTSQASNYEDYNDSQYSAYNDNDYNDYNENETYTKPPSTKPLKTLPKNNQTLNKTAQNNTTTLDKKPKTNTKTQDMEYENTQYQEAQYQDTPYQTKPIKKATKNINNSVTEKYPHES